VSGRKLDPERGGSVAAQLRGLGVRGVLITAAQRGYIVDLACAVRRAASLSYRTQRVTEADLRVGQIRIPVSGPTKALFPPERGPLAVSLRGRSLSVRWDPRMGPDRERSGVLRFDDRAALRELVRADEVLRVTPSLSGGVSID
jgi:hypothetical protein